MNAEQAANIISIGAAGIAILSMAVACWAVAEARKSRVAAERAAAAAEQSAQAEHEANLLARSAIGETARHGSSCGTSAGAVTR